MTFQQGVLEVASQNTPNLKKQKTLGEISSNSGSKMSAQSETRFRTAMIGTRYAETILKSQQNMILNESNKTEKERLRKKKANTEVEIRAAKMELKKMQRLKEMQIARLEIDKIQRTVEWNDALYVTREFEMLIGVRTCPVRSFTIVFRDSTWANSVRVF